MKATPENGSEVGLCTQCEHCRVVRTDRSVFYLCQKSQTDPRFPKYPRLPVRSCPGYEERRAPADEPAPGNERRSGESGEQ